MGYSRRLRNLKNKEAFITLFPGVQFPQGMKCSELKNLYSILVQLSSNDQDSDLEICYGDTKVSFEYICDLGNIIFKELEERFEKLFSKLYSISAGKDLLWRSSSFNFFEGLEELSLLYRSCMLLLTLFGARINLVKEKGLILLRILRKLISSNLVEKSGKNSFVFEKSVFHECAPDEDGIMSSSVEGFTASLQFLEPYNPLLVLKTTLLEVFVDEMFAHQRLTGDFKIINSAAATDERLFNPHSAPCDSGIVIEAICNHFILSYSDKKVFIDFPSRLFCTYAITLKYPFRAPELGVTAAVSLLLSPIMVSAPKYVQAHLISLVSEAVQIKSLKPDRELMNCFLSTFERSISLYMTHMTCLQTDGASNLSQDVVHPPFGFYISPETKHKINSLISKLDNYSNQDIFGSFFKRKSDLVSSSMRFVKGCQREYGISCQEEILDILYCLILKASEIYQDDALRPTEATTLQHLYLLTSVLKLMSISLLQAIRYLRHSDDLCSLKTLKDFTSCEEYEFILGTMNCFKDLDISLPLQQLLSSQMACHSTRHVDSKMMLLHFSGLMSLSFVSGLECLVKACLLAIFSLLNLFIFEEGNLDALIDTSKESCSSESPIVGLQETVVDRSYSAVVASKFHRLRSLYSRLSSQNGASASNTGDAACFEEEFEETTNGEILFKCMLQRGDDSDDLVDFVECKQGKDYSSWLKNRQKFRKWKSEKLAVLRWKRKKKSWKILHGNRN